jgi:hypothetical protein
MVAALQHDAAAPVPTVADAIYYTLNPSTSVIHEPSMHMHSLIRFGQAGNRQ